MGIRRTPSGHEVDVAIVASHLDKAVELLPGEVGGGEVDGVISLTNVKGSAVDGNSLDGGRNQRTGSEYPFP